MYARAQSNRLLLFQQLNIEAREYRHSIAYSTTGMSDATNTNIRQIQALAILPPEAEQAQRQFRIAILVENLC